MKTKASAWCLWLGGTTVAYRWATKFTAIAARRALRRVCYPSQTAAANDTWLECTETENLPAQSKEPQQKKTDEKFLLVHLLLSLRVKPSTCLLFKAIQRQKRAGTVITKMYYKEMGKDRERAQPERERSRWFLPSPTRSYDYVDYVNDYCLYRVRESISFMYLVTGRLTLSPYCKYKIKFTSTNCRVGLRRRRSNKRVYGLLTPPRCGGTGHFSEWPSHFCCSSFAATTNESRDKIMNESLKKTGARLSAPGQHSWALHRPPVPPPSAPSAHRQIYRLPQSFWYIYTRTSMWIHSK